MAEVTGVPSGAPDLTGLDVLRLLRSRLDSIVSGLDDCIAHGGEAGHPPLLNAGTVHVHGWTADGYVRVGCQDSHGIVEALFDVDVTVARETGFYPLEEDR